MTEDMKANEKLSPIVTKLFLKQRTLCKKHFTCFMSQPYFKVPWTIRVHVTHFIVEVLNKRASNHLSDIEFKDFMKL